MSAVLPTLLKPSLPHFGLVRGLGAEAYHAAGGLSYSGLKLLARSPAHYFAWKLDERAPVVERAGQLEGTLAHCLILEPGEFPFRYAVGPDVATRASREWKEFAAAHADKICIKPAQMAAAQAQAASVRALPEVARLLAAGEPEVCAFWRDEATGVSCQCRPDWAHPVGSETAPGAILVDVKTCSDASPAEFARQVARKRYHWQAAFYSDGYAVAAGVPVVGFVFVAVEDEWPFAACAVMLDDASLETARREIAPMVERFAACQREGLWPGYPTGIAQIELPAWYAPAVDYSDV